MTECLCEAEEGISLGRKRFGWSNTRLKSSGQGRASETYVKKVIDREFTIVV